MSGFVVRPFAFMRLTHEALRAGFATLEAAADAGDLEALRREYAALAPLIALHARHEEDVFFPTLDRLFDGATREAGLRETHEREAAHEQRVAGCLESGDLDGCRASVAEWSAAFEQHLKHEEDVMMPLTERVAPTVEGRAAVVRQILEVDWDSLERTHLPYVARSLARTKPYGPLRMFVAALQAAAGERYSQLAPVVLAAVPEEAAERLRADGHG